MLFSFIPLFPTTFLLGYDIIEEADEIRPKGIELFLGFFGFGIYIT